MTGMCTKYMSQRFAWNYIDIDIQIYIVEQFPVQKIL